MDRFPGSNDFGPEDHFDGEVSLPLNDHSVLPNFEQKMENQQEGDQVTKTSKQLINQSNRIILCLFHQNL